MTAKGLLSTEKIVLVGAGNVATHLGTALRDAGYRVLQVFSRTEESASALAGKLNCPYTTDINQVVPDAELYVVSVKDAVLAEVIPLCRWMYGKAKPSVTGCFIRCRPLAKAVR